MKAAVYDRYGPPEVLQLLEVPKPTPKRDEVLIRVRASTVTTGDVNIRNFVFVPSGFKFVSRLGFGLTKPRKPILGVELAGEVVDIGQEVKRFKPGDQVFGLDGTGLGAYAEYKCMPEGRGLVEKPANLSFEQAAAVPNGALTALTFLKKMGNIQPGSKVLINGASGSVGTAAVQLAKHFGAQVTGVCSTTNLALVKSLGADQVIDYTQRDFMINGERYDLVFDTVGKAPFSRCKNSLAPNGIYLAGAGGVREFRQMLWTSIAGGQKVMAGASSENQEDLAFIKELVESGELRPVIDRCYPFEELVEAHRYVDQGHKKGNVVITMVPNGNPIRTTPA